MYITMGNAAGWLFVLLTAFTVVESAGAEVVWRSKLYFATLEGDKHKENKAAEFGCDDVIYLFYESADQSFADSEFKVEWKNRRTRITHRTSEKFKPKSKGGRLWSWSGIEFSVGGSVFEKMTGFLDPAAGREQFIGTWDLEVSVDDKKIDSLTMRVLC